MFEVTIKKLRCYESLLFAVELLVNSAVVCIVTLCFQKQPTQLFYKKSVLRNFTQFTGKYLRQSPSFNKVAGLRPATLLKKKLWYRCLPVNFVELLRTPFLKNTSGRLLVCFEHAQIFHHFTFHVSLEVLYDNSLFLKLLTML